MDNNTLLCVIEVLGTIFIAAALLVVRNWPVIRQNVQKMGEMIRANQPQWTAILTSILGANLGYIILAGAHFLSIQDADSAFVEHFLFPAEAAIYFFCAFPIYVPIGVVCGLLVYRFVHRKGLQSRAGFVLALAISAFVGFIVAVPIYFLGLMGAAL